MKRIITISLYGVLCLLFINSAFAQNVTVKGTVKDATTGETLIGVSIAVQGTQTGTQTGPDGTYTISAPANGNLAVSYIGYASQTVAVNGQNTVNISLKAQSNELQQVVVVGYGTQRKIDVTGSVASVKGEEISKQASVNPVGALQGKVAGVQITNNGSPGASPQITIRGLGTIYGATNVLYVVDGVWYDDISFVNPADVENISILKDASSTAIYGLRAANGVVLVTTKRGKKNSTKVDYNGYAGWQTVTNPVKMANATEYATIINELYALGGKSPLFSDPNSYGKGTDWYGQGLRDAFVTNHQVSVNGGGEKSTYNMSLGYLSQDGNVRGNNYERFTARIVNDIEPVKNLKFGFNIGGLYSKSKDIPGGIFHELYSAAPVVPVYYADGSYGDPNDFNLGSNPAFNPQVTLDYFNQKSQNYRFNGNVYGELKFLKNFTFKTSLGGDIGQAESRNYSPVYAATLTQRNTISVLGVNRTETRNWIVENTLSYSNKVQDHSFTVLLGQTAQRNKSYSLTARAQNVPYGSEGDLYLTLGDQDSRFISDGGGLTTSVSYFGRVNYSFKDRYLLNASLRADANSGFYGANLWAYLPSIGAGWVVSNESFMKDQELFNTLKIKGSWGKVGNANVPRNPTIQEVTQIPQYAAIFGVDQQLYTGANIASFVPPTIVIERGVGTDIGIEASMLNSRLTIEADYYNRNTNQAIFGIPILQSLGANVSRIVGNQAQFRNTGFEFSAGWRDKVGKDFSYSLSGNFSINNNKVAEVVTGLNPIYAGGNGITNGALATRTVLGRPIGEFYGYKVDGIFQTAEEVAQSLQTSAKPGDFKYVDTNGDGILDSRDRVALGNPNPKYFYGFNTSFNYKNFDLALDFQGVAGVSIYNANIAYRFGNENFTKDFYDNRWHGAGTSNTYPSADVGSTSNSAPNSFYVQSGAYFRVRNIQFGYTLPGNWLSKWKIQRIRLYANAQNPINIFSYKGFNPEVGGAPTEAGIDANVYPLYATYNFGVNVSF
ncbi:TonB-dependent receptor [Mucilaginibacter defluvii]